jgi:phosphoglycolate phosphatase-like HAD superfamily hydrolase
LPAETLMVGDSVTDLRTARAAGASACVARYGFGFAQMPADELQGAAFLVDRPLDIAAVVGRFRVS